MEMKKGKSKNSNFNQVLWLGISQMSTFLVSFLSGMILSRYLPKGDYGTYRQVLFIYNTLFMVFSAGLASAYSFFVPRYSEEEAKTIVTKVTHILVFFGLSVSGLLYLLSGQIAAIMNNPDLELSLKIFCLTPLFTLPSLGVESLYTALRKTKIVALYQVSCKLLILLCSALPVVLFHKSYLDAIAGWTIASFVNFSLAFFLKWLPYRKIKGHKISGIYGKLSNYALPLVGACLAGLILNSASQFFISRYWGKSYYADYANGFIGLPFVVMVAGPLKAVLQPMFSKAAHDGDLKPALSVYENGVIQCITILFPIILFSWVFATDIMVLIYGEQYATSAPFFRISLIKDIFNCLPFLSIILAFGNTKPYLYAHVTAALSVWLIDIVLCSFNFRGEWYAMAYVLAELAIVALMINYIQKKYHLQILSKLILIRSLVVMSHSIIISVGCYYTMNNLLSHSIGTFIRISLCFSVYMLILSLSGKFVLKVDYWGSVVNKLIKSNSQKY